jgi:hypothetical protein
MNSLFISPIGHIGYLSMYKTLFIQIVLVSHLQIGFTKG